MPPFLNSQKFQERPFTEKHEVYLRKVRRLAANPLIYKNWECRLPDRTAMLRSIDDEAAKNRRRYKQSGDRLSPRHTLQVDFYPYKQSLEREMKTRRVPR